MAINDGKHQRAGSIGIGGFDVGPMIEKDVGAFGEAATLTTPPGVTPPPAATTRLLVLEREIADALIALRAPIDMKLERFSYVAALRRVPPSRSLSTPQAARDTKTPILAQTQLTGSSR